MTNDSKSIFEAYDRTDAQHPLLPQIRRSAIEEYDLDQPTDDEKKELGVKIANPVHHADAPGEFEERDREGDNDVSYEEEEEAKEEAKVKEGQIEITETNFNDVIRNAYDVVFSSTPRRTTTMIGGSPVSWVAMDTIFVSVNPEHFNTKISTRAATKIYKYYKRFAHTSDASEFYAFVKDAIAEYKGKEMQDQFNSTQDRFTQAYKKDASDRAAQREAIARDAVAAKSQVSNDFNTA